MRIGVPWAKRNLDLPAWLRCFSRSGRKAQRREDVQSGLGENRQYSHPPLLSYDLPRIAIAQGESEVKDSKRDVLFFVALIAALTFFVSFGAAAETEEGLSGRDEDAFILYKYSLMDAKKNRSPKISESTKDNETTYDYDGHALSCRTVMTGSITETTSENRTHVVGDFEVSNNSYGITQLSFDLYDEGKKTRTGTMTVNDKVIDIKHFDHR
jgi:hypothetical protein